LDETSIKVQGLWKYLYRAVEKATIDILLAARRHHKAAHYSLEKVIRSHGTPEKITVEQDHRAIKCVT
jgi:putative transposase